MDNSRAPSLNPHQYSSLIDDHTILLKQLKEYQLENGELLLQKTDLDTQIARLTSEKDQLAFKLRNCMQENVELVANKDAEIARLRGEIERVEVEKKKTMEEIEELKEKNNKLQRELDSVKVAAKERCKRVEMNVSGLERDVATRIGLFKSEVARREIGAVMAGEITKEEMKRLTLERERKAVADYALSQGQDLPLVCPPTLTSSQSPPPNLTVCGLAAGTVIQRRHGVRAMQGPIPPFVRGGSSSASVMDVSAAPASSKQAGSFSRGIYPSESARTSSKGKSVKDSSKKMRGSIPLPEQVPPPDAPLSFLGADFSTQCSLVEGLYERWGAEPQPGDVGGSFPQAHVRMIEVWLQSYSDMKRMSAQVAQVPRLEASLKEARRERDEAHETMGKMRIQMGEAAIEAIDLRREARAKAYAEGKRDENKLLYDAFLLYGEENTEAEREEYFKYAENLRGARELQRLAALKQQQTSNDNDKESSCPSTPGKGLNLSSESEGEGDE